MTLVDTLIQMKEKNQNYYLEYRRYALIIKQFATTLIGDDNLKVIVFGSVPS